MDDAMRTSARVKRDMECYLPTRYVLMGMIFMGWFNILLLRTNVSIAIVSMVNTTSYSEVNTTVESELACPIENATEEREKSSQGPFQWNSVQQGLALGCYYYGYAVSGVIGPWVAKRVGFTIVTGISVGLASVLTIMLPFAAYRAFELFIVCRVLIGFFQGVVIPTTVSSFTVWIPRNKKDLVFSILMCGYFVGAFITLPICSLICEYLSWEAVFYITGGFTLLWTLLWFLIIYDSPKRHPRISKEEKEYLQENVTVIDVSKNVTRRVPWLAILSSLPVWAAIISHFAYDWMFASAGLLLPTYMATKMKMDMTSAGVWSGFPYLIMLSIIIPATLFCDKIKNRVISLTKIRKIYIMIALLGPCCFSVLASYAGCNKTLGIFYFLLSITLLGMHVPGTEANFFDLSPTHCGILFGISGTISMCAGFLAPQIAGYVLFENNSISAWQTVFWIGAGVNVFAALFYLVFGTAEELNWSKKLRDQNDYKNEY
ncbi:sialin-like [Styela clava]|uniref:sialin-like n=1 Tax=Styela clava TaxID=7725 RepID=UPI001939F16B|nr:sialin-like [Styela clava]